MHMRLPPSTTFFGHARRLPGVGLPRWLRTVLGFARGAAAADRGKWPDSDASHTPIGKSDEEAGRFR